MNLDSHIANIKSNGYTLLPKVFTKEYCEHIKVHARTDIVDLNVFGATDVLTLGLVGFPPSIVAPPSLNQPPPSEPPLT